MSELEKLKRQNAELSDRIAKLEEAAKPPEPFVPGPRFQYDPTAGASMPPSAMLEMIKAVPDALMRVVDARRSNPTEPSSPAVTKEQRIADSLKGTSSAPQPQPPRQRGTGWAPEVPLSSPPALPMQIA